MGPQFFYHLLRNCDFELQQLEGYVSNFRKYISGIEEQVKNNSVDLIAFDDSLGRMTTIIEIVQNCNSKFLFQCVCNDDEMSKVQQQLSSPRAIMAANDIKEISSQFGELGINIDDACSKDNFNFQKCDLSQYNIGTLLQMRVTYVSRDQHKNYLSFYACDLQSGNESETLTLKEIIECKQYTDLPPVGEVFGLVVEKSVFRSIRLPNYTLLIDCGTVTQLKRTSVMYYLPSEKQMIPAKAILCRLEGIQSYPNVPFDELKNYLIELENRITVFYVQNITCDALCLLIVPESRKGEHIQKDKADKSLNEAEKPFDGFTREELEELYEEPLGTSNALKAVMGFVPQDEKRICRFFNPKTNSCFKGAHCRQDHELLNCDGYTKDMVPALKIPAHSYSYYFKSGSIINITVTFVERLECLYAQVNDAKVDMIPLVWSLQNIPDFKRLKRLPNLYDIVLAKYVDDFWYRARVLDVSDVEGTAKIFFVDYGNCQTISLNDLVQCSDPITQIPWQAIQFRLVNNKKDLTDEQRSHEINLFRNRVLNKTFDVEVIEQLGDDTLIRLFD